MNLDYLLLFSLYFRVTKKRTRYINTIPNKIAKSTHCRYIPTKQHQHSVLGISNTIF